ncbi:MAG: hypothetical protein WDN46_03090 [Methylocella sp.]
MKILIIALIGVGLLSSGSAFADHRSEKNVRNKPEGYGHVDCSAANKVNDQQQDWMTDLVQENEGTPNPGGTSRLRPSGKRC